jgi:hypothetical protein
MLAALFIFASLAICGYFLWKLADEWVAEYARPAGSDSIADRTCFRCRVHDVGFRCRRCRATIVPVEHIVVGAAARLGFAAGVNLGALLSLELDLEDMRCVTILVPRGVAVRSGDRVRFVFDHRHRLRHLENITLGTGWRLPVRASGERSPFSWFGLLAVVSSAPILLLSLLVYMGARSVERAAHAFDSGATFREAAVVTNASLSLAGLCLLCSILGAATLLLRSRPPLNRQLYDLVRSSTDDPRTGQLMKPSCSSLARRTTATRVDTPRTRQ